MNDIATSEMEELKRRNRQLELDVERLLKYDLLTGLVVRGAFINQVDQWLETLRQTNSPSAVIEIGIRGLPRITGSLGRHVSDYVISSLAARLNLLVTSGRLSCRLDQWSFAVFIPRITDALEALTFAKTIITALNEPIDWVDRKLNVEVGAGVVLTGPNALDAQTLLMQAGLALRSATDRGGPGYSFFNPALEKAASRKQDVLAAVQEALDRQYFELAYQPFFHATTGELTGFEALMRLKHPQFGVISPAEFIPVAEESGTISRLGAWALAEACRTAATWPAHLTIAVNFSPEQFLSGSLLTDVHNALELSSFPPYRLEIEITESTMLGDTEVVLSQLTALRELGCLIVMDDFGTGYSSLSYLWKFPFSKLKIDRSFVIALDTKPQVKGMLRSIIDLAKNLGLRVTAEGIETQAQADMLRQLHCDYIQGYLSGRPMPQGDVAVVILTKFASALKTAESEREALAPPPALLKTATDNRFEF